MIQREIESLEGVEEIHHLHVWNISSEGVALVAHVVVMDQMLSRVEEIADKIRHLLLNRFVIDHPVLQFETRACEGTGLLCCSVNGSMQKNEHRTHRGLHE